MFEHNLGISFTKINLSEVQQVLPKLLNEDMGLVEDTQIQIQDISKVTIELTGSILTQICEKIGDSKTHRLIGCLMSSAIACILAKSTGKPVIIQNETINQETKTTHIEYQLLEG